jgi:anti-sigma factor RsiW
MTRCEHVRPVLGAYVLGALDADEAAQVRRHLQECPDCAAERDTLAPLPDLLSLAGGAEAATAEPLPPAFEERLLDAYARDRAGAPRRRASWLRRRLRPRWLAAAAATATAATVAVAVVTSGGEEPVRGYEVTFTSTAAAGGAQARGNLDSGDEGTTLHLWIRGLPRDPNAVYEVLCDSDEWTASAGTFRTDADGRAYVIMTTALRRGEYDAIRIVRRTHRPDGRLVKRNLLAARLS